MKFNILRLFAVLGLQGFVIGVLFQGLRTEPQSQTAIVKNPYTKFMNMNQESKTFLIIKQAYDWTHV